MEGSNEGRGISMNLKGRASWRFKIFLAKELLIEVPEHMIEFPGWNSLEENLGDSELVKYPKKMGGWW